MSDTRFWLGFNMVPHIGPVRMRALLDHFGDLEPAWRASATSLRAAGLPLDCQERLLYLRDRIDLDAELDKVKTRGIKLLTWDSPDYPPLLLQIAQPPPLLYVLGDVLPVDERAVAIVGTRDPSPYGEAVAYRLASDLARNGITIVSGLALGIDGVAHRAALDAGGRTLAVLGCGLDCIYPARHQALAKRIVTSGALISDYALGIKPDARNFPPRNRIISGLSLGTVVVEAGQRSGALITLRFALEQDRETFAVPGNVHNAASDGTNAAIQRGEAKLVTRADDILEELRLTRIAEQEQVRQVVPDTPDERTLLQCLGAEPVHIDELVRSSGLPTATVSSTLCMMELKGMVRRVDNLSYQRAH
ncbi:MAG: DNA-processing protein DprA [Anaerolineae bacterium]